MRRLVLVAIVLVGLAVIVRCALVGQHKAPQATLAQDPNSGIGLPQNGRSATDLPPAMQQTPAQRSP